MKTYPKWYSYGEIEHILQRMNYSPAIIAELAPWFLRHITSAFNKGFERGTASLQADHRILWGIVANAGRLSDQRRYRWAHVMDATGLGSTRSIELCRRFGFDPEQEIGGNYEQQDSSDR